MILIRKFIEYKFNKKGKLDLAQKFLKNQIKKIGVNRFSLIYNYR